MRTRPFLICLLVILKHVTTEEVKEEVLKVSARDSYLDAYQDSHLDALKNSKSKKLEQPSESSSAEKIDREFTVDQSQPYHVYSAPNVDNYGAPKPQYGPPTPQYGPPTSQYGLPSSQYGSPSPQAYGPLDSSYGPPSYGPPSYEPQYKAPGPVYGGPQSVQVFYGQGMPHALLSFWDKLKFKLDLFTIGKILLKLVIFKKIVSLIAIVCLLLFIPALKNKVSGSSPSSDESDVGYMRGIGVQKEKDDLLNTMTAFLEEAVAKYSEWKKHGS